MRKLFMGLLILSVSVSSVMAQKACYSFDYQQQQMRDNPELSVVADQIGQFISTQGDDAPPVSTTSRGNPLIVIPVVVHVVYNNAAGNVSDETVRNLIETLNLCYRKLHPDTIKTPARFAGLSADCEIEFQLAVSDPQRRATTGIVRKYSTTAVWDSDDKVKFSNQSGDDAWDAKSYLNIWICNIRYISGYASVPGDVAAKDGVVLSTGALGKTVVHEVGHWLGLKHIWGDQYCGDDGVADTPPQALGTAGCPSGIRLSCSSSPNGDMYMNYMDVTQDACVNMFTYGQKERMHALLKLGGLRYSLFASTGLTEPLYTEIPLPEDTNTTNPSPDAFKTTIYPNPALQDITLDLGNDPQWIGKTIIICNAQGQTMQQQTVQSKTQKIDISRLKAGMYFIVGKREDGRVLKQKFIKLN
jgi:hypothetical protein